jgi:hypothetical protein
MIVIQTSSVFKRDGIWYYRADRDMSVIGGFATKEGAALAASHELGPTVRITEIDDPDSWSRADESFTIV